MNVDAGYSSLFLLLSLALKHTRTGHDHRRLSVLYLVMLYYVLHFMNHNFTI